MRVAGQVVLAHEVRKPLQSFRRSHPDRFQVDVLQYLLADGFVATPAARGNRDQAVGGIDAREEIRVSGLDGIPARADKVDVTGRVVKVAEGNEVHRTHVGVAVRVRIVLEPVDESRALREFVKDFAVVPLLILLDEADGIAGKGVVTRSFERIRIVEGVATEKPGVLRAADIARRSVTRHEPAAEPRITNIGLIQRNARPRVGEIHAVIGRFHLDSAGH